LRWGGRRKDRNTQSGETDPNKRKRKEGPDSGGEKGGKSKDGPTTLSDFHPGGGSPTGGLLEKKKKKKSSDAEKKVLTRKTTIVG